MPGGAFDIAAFNAKSQIDDAISSSQRLRPLQGPPQEPSPVQVGGRFMPAMSASSPSPSGMAGTMSSGFGGLNLGASAPVGPGNLDVNVGLDPQLAARMAQMSYGMPIGPGQAYMSAQAQNMPGPGGWQPSGFNAGYSMPVGGGQMDLGGSFSPAMGLRDLSARYSAPGGAQFGLGYQPANNAASFNARVPFARGGLAKGGAWTRKEGQNPEGGLNEKGRASLRAQGHNIKRPVSAEQASKSPRAAARRKSFCARMSGMPGAMKDEQGRPTRKALSLRKWDCHAEGGPIWERERPDDLGKPKTLSAKKKAAAKRRAKAAGRPYPNMVDNLAMARKKGK